MIHGKFVGTHLVVIKELGYYSSSLGHSSCVKFIMI